MSWALKRRGAYLVHYLLVFLIKNAFQITLTWLDLRRASWDPMRQIAEEELRVTSKRQRIRACRTWSVLVEEFRVVVWESISIIQRSERVHICRQEVLYCRASLIITWVLGLPLYFRLFSLSPSLPEVVLKVIVLEVKRHWIRTDKRMQHKENRIITCCREIT